MPYITDPSDELAPVSLYFDALLVHGPNKKQYVLSSWWCVKLTREPKTLHGAHGRNATRAVPGAPAGYIRFQLVPSQLAESTMTVRILGNESKVQLQGEVEISKNQNLLVTANGGNGENGRSGESGGNGLDGQDGMDATETMDSTV